METIPELSVNTKNFVKAILLAGGDQNLMGWFQAGGRYMDAISLAILTLPEDDPTLPPIVESILSGQLFEAETVAKNMLRWDMARPEMDEFVRAHVAGRAANALLYFRNLGQERMGAAKEPALNLSLFDFWLATLKIVFWVSPIVTWMIVKRNWGRSFKTEGSLKQKWAAALRDPAWWTVVVLVAAGTALALS